MLRTVAFSEDECFILYYRIVKYVIIFLFLTGVPTWTTSQPGSLFKHFNSFENACHLLDVQIAKCIERTPSRLTTYFAEGSQKYTKAIKLDEEAESLDDGTSVLMDHLATVEDPQQAAVYHETIQQYLRERNTLVSSNSLCFSSNPHKFSHSFLILIHNCLSDAASRS